PHAHCPASPRDTTPTSTGPAPVAAYAGPPESPKHASAPAPPAMISPPGSIAAWHAASVVHVASVIGIVAQFLVTPRSSPSSIAVVIPNPTTVTSPPARSVSRAVHV